MKSDGRLLPFLESGPPTWPTARPERRRTGGDDHPPAPRDVDRELALALWWSELDAAERRRAAALPADAVLPEELVVSLLLYGALTAAESSPPAGGVAQPRELRRFLARRTVLD